MIDPEQDGLSAARLARAERDRLGQLRLAHAVARTQGPSRGRRAYPVLSPLRMDLSLRRNHPLD
jgi:hypothetical protein